MAQLNLVRLALCALAVYRFTILLYEESGPFHIFETLRTWAGVYVEQWQEVDEQGQYTTMEERQGEGFFAELLNCPYCLSGWIALPIIVAPKWLTFWGGIWGLVYLLLKRTHP